MPHAASSALLRELADLLGTRRFGRPARAFDRVDSTNTLAAQWAAEGAPEGALVFAEYQSAGRGRLGRSWEAAPGQNLTFSLVLRPPLAPPHLGRVTMAAGIAVSEAIEGFTAPHAPQIKWPNDILLEGRKCCGMLLEASFPPRRPGCVILGIGLNVNQDAFPPALAARATSLLLATGRHTPRAPLLAELLRRLELHYDALLHAPRRLQHLYEERLTGLGGPIALRFSTSDEEVRGTFRGVTDTGALCLDTPAGTQVFHAGEVTTERS